MCSKVNQLYIYPLFFRCFYLVGYYKYWVEFPVLYWKLLLSILYVVVSLCQSQFSNLSLPFTPNNHKFVFYICNYFCSVFKFICTIFKYSTYKWYHVVFVFLWLHSVWHSVGPSMLLQMELFIYFFMTWVILTFQEFIMKKDALDWAEENLGWHVEKNEDQKKNSSVASVLPYLIVIILRGSYSDYCPPMS